MDNYDKNAPERDHPDSRHCQPPRPRRHMPAGNQAMYMHISIYTILQLPVQCPSRGNVYSVIPSVCAFGVVRERGKFR